MSKQYRPTCTCDNQRDPNCPVHGDHTLPKFDLGRTVATPGALRAIEEAQEVSATYLYRHQRGDRGDLSLSDQRANDRALKDGSRIFSAYVLPRTEQKIWIITEAEGEDGKRASTCALLPDEY